MPVRKSERILIILLILLIHASLLAQTSEVKITGTFSGSAIEVFKQIRQQYKISFYYKDEWFIHDQINITFRNNSPAEVAATLIEGKGYTFRIINNNIIFLPIADVATMLGEIPNFSNAPDNEQITRIGDLSEAGKHKLVWITGRISDGKTGEPIIAATIQIQNPDQEVLTNVQGDYKLQLAPGIYTLNVSSLGYEGSSNHVKVVSSGEYNIELFDNPVRFEDVLIQGKRADRNVTGHQMGLIELNIREIGHLPSVAGSIDVIKGLTIMPGVKSIGEFSSGINVRGGGEDQNLYLLNSAPLFFTTHVFGLISAINPDAVEKLSIYKGHIPAIFGERVSSVIDIKSSDKIPEKLTIKGGAGLYDSRLMVEIPIMKNKLWVNIGGRSSYSDWILKSFKEHYLKNSSADFYDLSGNFHLNLGKSRIAFSGYRSHDNFRLSSDTRYSYGNSAGSLSWNYIFRPDLASYLTLSFSDYNVDRDDIGRRMSRISKGIQYKGIKYRVQFGGIATHNLDAGISLCGYRITPGKISPLREDVPINRAVMEKEEGYESAVFINDEFTWSNTVLLNIGLRYSAYGHAAPGNVWLYEPGLPKDTSTITGIKRYDKGFIKVYHGFEPRVSVRLKVNESGSLKLSYNRNIQYISLISYTNVSTPADIWKLAGTYIRPLIASQFAVGFYKNFYNNSIESSIEAYYKKMKNVLEYTNGPELEMNSHIETELVHADGRNYGIEFLVRKNSGRLGGMVTYTWSRSLRKTNGSTSDEIINRNRFFPSSYDRPHDFGLIGNFNLNRKIRFSVNFSYATGRPITLPEFYYDSESDRPWLGGRDEVPVFSERNKYRLEPYHRLDISLIIAENLRVMKNWKSNLTISILNVYGRKNPYTVYYKMEEPSILNNYKRFSLYKLYFIGRPVPSVTFNFNF